MHAILVTFRPQASEQEIMAAFGAKLKEGIPKTPGLIMKTYLGADPQTWGGFYLFDNAENGQAFLKGELFTEFSNSPLMSDFDIRHFGVEDEPSVALGTPSQPLAQSAARVAS